MNSPKIGKEPLHPYCNVCGWRKGGLDSWDGNRCKCGHYEPPMSMDDPANPAMPLNEARVALKEFPGRIRASDLFEFLTDKESDDYDDDILLSCDTAQENDLTLMEEMARRYNAFEDLQAEVNQLRRYCKEWVCEACNTCFPDPPHLGVLCVVCPKCGGTSMPYPLWEVRRATGQRDALEDAIRQIYTGAKAFERGEEPLVECAQNIQRICDAALREIAIPDIYVPVSYPSAKEVR